MTLALAIGVASCGDPLDAEIPTDPADQVELYKATVSLGDEDKKVLQAYMERMKQEKLEGKAGVPPGTTVRVALEQQKTWERTVGAKLRAEREAAQKRLQELEEKQKREKEEMEKKMLEIATVEVVRKVMKKSGFGEAFDMDLKFTNKSDKELSMLIGKLQILGPDGKVLKEVKIPYRKTLKAGRSATKGGKFPYNPDRKRDVALANAKLKELTVKWIPLVYKFADGTRLGTEPEDPRLR
jgi:hypothetical protein